jgi:glucose/arabinose dehydrogenase
LRSILVVAALAVAASLGALVAHAGSGARAALRLETIATGLDQPLYVLEAPGEPDRLYVVEQPGRVRTVRAGLVSATPFLDIHAQVSCCGEQGLLSIAFHPDYAKNKRVYVAYTDRAGDSRVVEYRTNGVRVLPATARQLLFVHQPYSNHNGGQLEFASDGKLYFGLGDGGSGGDPQDNGQNLDTRLAKLLRTDPLRVRWEIVAYGLRNPWRFSFDRANGDLYIGDVGQSAWEEIDYSRGGARPANYGWSRYEGRHVFKDTPVNPASPLVFPIAEYSRSDGCSVIGGYVYRGTRIPALVGRYVYGDYCSGTIWSLRVVGGRATAIRREGITVKSLSSFGVDSRGEIYATSLDGVLYRLAA